MNYKIIEQPGFPINLFNFRDYNGLKSLMALMFLLSNVYFVIGMYGLLMWQDSWYWPDSVHKTIIFSFHIMVYFLVYCMTWIAFDLKNVIGYASGLFSMIVGIVYILSPADFVPDLFPILGTIDDALVGGGSIAFSLQSILQTNFRRKQIQMIMSITQNNDAVALEKILELDGFKKSS